MSQNQSENEKHHFKVLGSKIEASSITPQTNLYSFLRSWFHSNYTIDPTSQLDEETTNSYIPISLPSIEPPKEIEKIDYKPESKVEELLTPKTKKSVEKLTLQMLVWAKNCRAKHKQNHLIKKKRFMSRLAQIDKESQENN